MLQSGLQRGQQATWTGPARLARWWPTKTPPLQEQAARGGGGMAWWCRGVEDTATWPSFVEEPWQGNGGGARTGSTRGGSRRVGSALGEEARRGDGDPGRRHGEAAAHWLVRFNQNQNQGQFRPIKYVIWARTCRSRKKVDLCYFVQLPIKGVLFYLKKEKCAIGAKSQERCAILSNCSIISDLKTRAWSV